MHLSFKSVCNKEHILLKVYAIKNIFYPLSCWFWYRLHCQNMVFFLSGCLRQVLLYVQLKKCRRYTPDKIIIEMRSRSTRLEWHINGTAATPCGVNLHLLLNIFLRRLYRCADRAHAYSFVLCLNVKWYILFCFQIYRINHHTPLPPCG